jgi:lipopolysaccharide export system protein LptA
MNPSLKLLLIALLLLAAPLASATSGDTQQPITIEADRAEIDERQAVSVYSGNVLLSQGSLQVEADTVTVHAEAGQLRRIIAEGSPVHYRQQRDNEADIRGQSLRMEYDADSKRLLLLNNAELWQGENRFSGERIQYDPEQDRVIASGAAEGEGADRPRVRVTLQPKPATDNEEQP